MNRGEWAQIALQRASERVQGASKGTRHKMLYGSARDMGRYVRDGHLGQAEVESALAEAGSAAGKDGREVRRAVRDGVASGAADHAPAWYPAERAKVPKAFVHKGRQFQLGEMGAQEALEERAAGTVGLVSSELPEDATVRLVTFQGLHQLQGGAADLTWPELGALAAKPQAALNDVKDAVLICAAELPGDSRAKTGHGAVQAERFHALILDYDDDPEFSLPRSADWWGEVTHLTYTSKSHQVAKDKKGAGPRGRVIVALSRPVTREEYWILVPWVEGCGRGEMGVQELHTEARVYYAPIATKHYDHQFHDVGRAIDVDAMLAAIGQATKEVRDAVWTSAPDAAVLGRLDTKIVNEGKETEYEKVIPSLKNLVTVLEMDHRWVERVRYCDFSHRLMMAGRPMNNVDHLDLKLWTAEVYEWEPSTDKCQEALLVVAGRHKQHPVREYLDGLRWDGQERLGRMLVERFKCEDDDDGAGLSRALGTRWMIGAVARIYQPGCKLDEMLTLVGKQGSLKSTGLRVLAGDEWFSDTTINISSKDAYMALQGVWIYEAAELDSFSRAAATQIKQFLSSATDKFRPPYAKLKEAFPRQCVIAGTTNEDTFLHDNTGNRRAWVRRIPHGEKVDVDGLRRDRDQLWAEAVHLYRAGEQWYLTDEEAEAHQEDVKQYVHEDPWLDHCRALLRERGSNEGVTVNAVLDRVHLDQAQRHKGHEMRVGGLLTQLGAQRRRVTRDGARTYRYFGEVG